MLELGFPSSNPYMSAVPIASTMTVARRAVARRSRSFECSSVLPRVSLWNSSARSRSRRPRYMPGLSRSARTGTLALQRPSDQPVVAERVREAALPQTVLLIGDRENLGRALRDRTPGHGIWVRDKKMDADGRAAERLWTQVERVRHFVDDHDPGLVDRHLRHDSARVRCARELRGTERTLVEVDRSARIPRCQNRLDRRHFSENVT